MTTIGSPAKWAELLQSLVPDILTLVLDTWNDMPPPPADALEVPISNTFALLLRRAKDRCEMPFNVYAELVELEPADGEQGRIDIHFAPDGAREHIYFCLECKRLHVTTEKGVRPYYSEYVTKGVYRFVTGHFASRVEHGGMLGFVLDGDLSRAIAGVEANLKDKHEELGMAAPGGFQQSSVHPAHQQIRETRHTRAGNLGAVVVHHVFVAGGAGLPGNAAALATGAAARRRRPRSGSR